MIVKKHYDWGAPRSTWIPNETIRTKPLVDPRTGQELVTVDEETGERTPIQSTPPVTHVEIKQGSSQVRFSERTVDDPNQPWIWRQGNAIMVRTDQGDIAYAILTVPGRYSCFTNEKLPDDDYLPNGNRNPGPTGELARQHIEDNHPGEESPDPENPAGYRCERSYLCMAP